MAFDFSTLVTDRKQSDVAYVKQLISKIVEGTATEAELAEWKSFTLKGSYNYTDFNRVNAAMEQLKAQLDGYGYAIPGYRKVQIPHTELPSSRLPSGYTELKYIKSTGTQYIDTGLSISSSTYSKYRFVQDVMYPTLGGSFYLVNGCSGSGVVYYFGCTPSGAVVYGNGASDRTTSYSTTANKRITIDFNAVGGMYTFDGNETALSLSAPSGTNNFFLFGYGNASQLHTERLYSFQAYLVGSLVRDYVPCINPSGEVGLYDLVDGVFCGNAGTGAFVAGMPVVKLPDGYKQVEYIQSSGTQYINTGVIGRLPVSVSLKMRTGSGMSSTDTVMLGMYQADAHATPIYLFNGTWYVSVGSTGKASPGGYLADNTDYEVESTLTTSDYNVTVNGTTVINGSATSSSGGTNVLYLFARNDFGTATRLASARLDYCKLYQNNVLVRDFVPCIDSSGKYGLYDKVNAQFYGNAGTGSFTGGAVVEWDAISNEQIEYDPYLWYERDIPTPELMENYLENVQSMRSVLELFDSTPATPDSMSGLTYSQANAIEQILFDIDKAIKQTVGSFVRLNAFTVVSGNRPLPSVDKDIGRTWAELDAMQTIWRNWDVATWFLLLHGNLTAVETEV